MLAWWFGDELGGNIQNILPAALPPVGATCKISPNTNVYKIYSLVSKINQFFDLLNMITTTFLFCIALVLVLLSFADMTNSNTILNGVIVFQHNTRHIVHL
jgi:hypothetical protein